MTVRVVKAGPGLDPDNIIQRVLGPDYEVVQHDPAAPLEAQVAGAAVLLLRDRPITASVIDAAPGLKLLQRYGQHVVGVDFAHAALRGIPVANVPTSVTGADRVVAEHALHLMMSVAKRSREAEANVLAQVLGAPKTMTLSGKTLVLVGVGNTGAELNRLVGGFDMRVLAVKRSPDPELARTLAFLGTMDDLDTILAEADFVSVHLPLNANTRGFFDARRFQAMKPEAVLINISRGPIVDQVALVRALESGHLGGAGLDVVEEEPIDPGHRLLTFGNVVITPHIAGVTDEIGEKASLVVKENIERVLAGSLPLHQLTAAV